MIDGEGSKPASVSSAGAILGETGSGMKQHAGDVGTFTTRRNRALRHSWYHHYMAPSHPGVTVSSSNTEPESTLIRPSASTAATSYVPFSVMPIDSNPAKVSRTRLRVRADWRVKNGLFSRSRILGTVCRPYMLSQNYADMSPGRTAFQG
jgi:hypothetical protein